MYKLIATAAFAAALIPCAASAQSKTTQDSAAARRAVTATSAGEVSGPGADVTATMLKAQQDPNVIGTPAWWTTHATADGKPLSAAPKR